MTQPDVRLEHVTKRFHEVVAVDDLSTGLRGNLVEVAATLREGSILDRHVLDEAMADAGAVVHLAARPSVPRSLADPMASHLINATGTMEVLEAARRAGRAQIIVASSSSVYGSNPAIPKVEDLVPMPMSPYAASKLAAESYALAHAASFGMDVLAFRFFNVFGPLQAAGHAYAAVVPAFIDAALAGRPLQVHGDGRQTRDFTFVETVATVITEAITRRVCSERPVNLAFGSRVSLLELIDVLSRLLGEELAVEHGPARTGDVRDSQADQRRLRSLFPDIAPVDLETGLGATLEWFRRLPVQS
ncbi:MAG: NAD-dependent epimerase/dehydratase family protein [Candidatus Limnocylindrales bacterium]